MLTTLANFKRDYLDRESIYTDQDNTITTAILSAGSFVRTYCKQPVEQESVDYYFSGSGASPLSLSAQLLGAAGTSDNIGLPYTVPVSLTSLSYKVAPSDSSWTSITGATVYKSADLYRVYYSGGFPFRLYKAVLSVGYATVPDDVIAAASQLALYFLKEGQTQGDSRAGVSSVTTSQGGVTVTQAYKNVVQQVAPTLDRYKML